MKKLLLILTFVSTFAFSQTLIRAVDASGVSHIVLKLYSDSGYVLVPLRLDTQVTMPSRGGYIARNGTGDTVYYTFGASGTLAKLSFNGQANNKVFGDSGGIWQPIMRVDSARISATSGEERMFTINFGDSVNTTSTATTVVSFSPVWSCTIDSIVAYKANAGTGSYNATKIHLGTAASLFSGNVSLTSTRTAGAITGNNTLVSTDELRIQIVSPSSVWAIIFVYWHRTS